MPFVCLASRHTGPGYTGSFLMEVLRRFLDRKGFLLVSGFGALGLSFAITTGFWSFQTSLVLDDYLICTGDVDVTGLLRSIWDLTGPYRPFTYPAVAFRAVTCNVFVIHKVLGIGLHLLAGWMLWKLAVRIGMSASAAIAGVVVFLFSPFALEAMAWPAVVYGYPLTAVFLLGFALVLFSPGSRLGLAATLALLAVTSNEQTLGVVALLPFAVAGSWRDRTKRAAAVVAPIGLYVAIVGATAATTNFGRSESFGPKGIDDLLGNTGELLTAVTRVFPPGSIWRAFQAGPGFTPFPALIAAIVGVALILRGGESGATKVQGRATNALVVALAGIASTLILMLPIYVQEPPWLSPRYLYLPYLGFGLAVAALFEAAIRAQRALRNVAPVVAILLVALVGDGLLRDARDYRVTFEGEKAIATEITDLLAARPYERLVLVNSPWTLAPGTPPLGEHVVHAFAVVWTIRGALETLGSAAVDVPIDLGGEALCESGGEIRVGGTEDAELSAVLVFDVASRTKVANLQMPSGDTVPLGDLGATYALSSCALGE